VVSSILCSKGELKAVETMVATREDGVAPLAAVAAVVGVVSVTAVAILPAVLASLVPPSLREEPLRRPRDFEGEVGSSRRLERRAPPRGDTGGIVGKDDEPFDEACSALLALNVLLDRSLIEIGDDETFELPRLCADEKFFFRGKRFSRAIINPSFIRSSFSDAVDDDGVEAGIGGG